MHIVYVGVGDVGFGRYILRDVGIPWLCFDGLGVLCL